MEKLTFGILFLGLCWAVASRAYWKTKAIYNEGVLFHLPNGQGENCRGVIKYFPGGQKTALESACDFLERQGFKKINTASRSLAFARGNERIHFYFLRRDGLVLETPS